MTTLSANGHVRMVQQRASRQCRMLQQGRDGEREMPLSWGLHCRACILDHYPAEQDVCQHFSGWGVRRRGASATARGWWKPWPGGESPTSDTYLGEVWTLMPFPTTYWEVCEEVCRGQVLKQLLKPCSLSPARGSSCASPRKTRRLLQRPLPRIPKALLVIGIGGPPESLIRVPGARIYQFL